MLGDGSAPAGVRQSDRATGCDVAALASPDGRHVAYGAVDEADGGPALRLRRRGTGEDAVLATAQLVAVSPDGARAVVAVPSRHGELPFDRAAAVVLRVVDGAELARLVLPEAVGNVGPGGEWRDGRVVTTRGHLAGGGARTGARLVTLRVGEASLAVESHLQLLGDDEDALAGTTAPRFVDGEPGRAGAWVATAPGDCRYVECDLAGGACAFGAPHDVPVLFSDNPSRPPPG